MFALLFFSCKKENNNETAKVFNPHFSNPQAILLQIKDAPKNASKSSVSTVAGTANLFQLDGGGNISPIVDSVNVTNVVSFSNGLILTLDNNDRYIVYLDNTFFKLPSSFEADLKGENENGDLVFSDVSIIRRFSQEITKLQTTLTNPSVQSMSGNFAIIHGGSVFQIFNTVTNERYNVNDCNGPVMVALNKYKALINDCQGNALITMANGQRVNADVSMWNGEHLYLKDGAAIMNQGTGIQDQSMYGLGIVDIMGRLTIICNDGFKPGSSACMNCGAENAVLFAYGDYFIIRELDKISVVKRGILTKKVILSGYNVTSVSVNADKVFFIAEDNLGKRKAGIYSLVTDITTILDSQVQFDRVLTIR